MVDESPDMVLFHSVKLPGETGDVDQLLYAGGAFYLVDAKLWKGFEGQRRVTYDVAMRDSESMVFVRDGQPFAGGDVKAPKQLHKWRRYLAGHRVLSVIVLMDPGAIVAPNASNPDVLVLNALQVQGWLRSLPVVGRSPLHDVWIRELAGLTFDPTRSPRPPQQHRSATARSQHRPGTHVPPPAPSHPSVAVPPLPRVATPPLPNSMRPDVASTSTVPAMRPRAEHRASRFGKRSLGAVLMSWLLWLLTLAIYLPTQSAPLIANLTMLASLSLAIAAIVLGAKGIRRARRTATSSTAARWGMGLGVAHAALGFAAPVTASLVMVLASQL
ncbi:hypothetical protein ABIB37_000354 [Agrococcus sp. UYP10]|uniref:hypothetical protein n=1 Tax=Agrococcus sp. UYP10 TaxID=1756355 RepID=UPI0033968A5F